MKKPYPPGYGLDRTHSKCKFGIGILTLDFFTVFLNRDPFHCHWSAMRWSSSDYSHITLSWFTAVMVGLSTVHPQVILSSFLTVAKATGFPNSSSQTLQERCH